NPDYFLFVLVLGAGLFLNELVYFLFRYFGGRPGPDIAGARKILQQKAGRNRAAAPAIALTRRRC
ncbi:hypothetical protein, partial [Mesorhizobium sp. M0322]|uniref:hypothetical protein n=1 Tax=Mesorhizobium sp. M0322 TaxID=2956937 RepID=UPI003336B161